MSNNDNKHRMFFNDKEIILLGTAHVSRESAEFVHDVIMEEKPETVCIELCESRYQSLTQKNKWQDTDLVKVIKGKKAFLLLSNLMLASFQKKIAKKLGIKPGEDMMSAIKTAEETGAEINLADRNIRVTLSRIWRLIGLWAKIKLLVNLVSSIGEVEEIEEADIEKLKEKDVLETLLSEMEEKLPELRQILIDERDQYLSYKIKTAPGKKIVAVVGAGHVPGIKKYWEKKINMDLLEEIPPKGRVFKFFKWGIPAAIIALFITGFFSAGISAGAEMIKWWVLANAVLAGLGAAIALAHPLTVLSAVVASPLTSLNPMIAAGWVSGLFELVLRKPKVKDFESLPEDIVSIKGFWKNKITRILLVVVFTNLGSSLGTFVAIPLMAKIVA
ncbi:MAG TPA: TraB/GumN family protein [Desulfobacteraceae bacterium]|nr:TraB/GumN family protein [Desulfobacteraceae bacterium]